LPTDGSACSAKYSPPPKKKKTFPAIFMGGGKGPFQERERGPYYHINITPRI